VKLSKAMKTATKSFDSHVSGESQVGKDMAMLRDLVGALGDAAAKGGFEGKTAAEHLTTFGDMLDRMENGKLLTLTERQRAFVKGVHGRYYKGEGYRNDWSAGRVEKGREVPLPEVLRVLPKKPPTRMVPR